MYIKAKTVHFDAMTITVVMFGKFVCTFFLWESQHFLDKDQISSGEGQKEGVRGEAQNEGYFFKIPIIQQDINSISQTFGHTNF